MFTQVIKDYLEAKYQEKAKKEKELEKLAQLRAKYQPNEWLTDATKRAKQISIVTHAPKFTHQDSKASGLYYQSLQDEGYVNSASMQTDIFDVVGNAAAMDVAGFLRLEKDGRSIFDALRLGDDSVLRPFAKSEAQLQEWMEGLRQAWVDNAHQSHSLAKQIYFPLEDGSYHLISPNFATSFAQVIYEKVQESTFSDEAKKARDARKKGEFHEMPDERFPELAHIQIGGSNPQNISALNSKRTGTVYLFSAASPTWRSLRILSERVGNVFNAHIMQEAKWQIKKLADFLNKNKDENNIDIREERKQLESCLLDELFLQFSFLQQQPAGWTQSYNHLDKNQKLYLDPYNETLAEERLQGAWQERVTKDAANFIRHQLEKAGIEDLGMIEHRHYSKLFNERLKEEERQLKEELKARFKEKM